jgi:iron complex outermembrane receptor protein
VLLDTTFVDLGYALASPRDPDPSTQDFASFDHTSIRFATSYDFRDNLMGYIGYTEGFNAGNVGRYTEQAGVYDGGIFYPEMDITYRYDPEEIENWEIGMRGDFLDKRLRANVTYFHTAWNGIQLATSVFHTRTIEPVALTETTIQNAADGLAKGLEFELTFAATDHFVVGANLGFLDTGYTVVLPAANRPIDTEFGGAPDKTYNLNAAYTWNLTGGAMVMARVEANYISRFWRSDNPGYRASAYGGGSNNDAGDVWKAAARVVFTPAEGNYDVSLWGNNLTNEFVLNSGFIDNIWGFDFAGVDAPREVGLSFRMRF